ncbi:hypothetical protein SEA_MAGRITTE_209 [Microbacterium phage Magritte]|nr:hypothetical protein SEA_MAGRITTE_209 [Microbacterium phage Magritte]
MSNKLKFALIAAGAGAFWVILVTFLSIGLGEWARTGLGWEGSGAGMLGVVVWLTLVFGVPGAACGVYGHIAELEKKAERGY